MITVRKGHEPVSLTQFRASGGKEFENLDSATKNEIRDSLLKEQGYICAYCMKRIGRGRSGALNDVKIEHVIPRAVTRMSSDPQINLMEIDYSNMVAVCLGVTNGMQHCDTSKADRQISFHPCNPALEDSISYSLRDGEIRSDNKAWNEDITDKEKLNLNHPVIKNNRRAALNGLIEALKRSDRWSASQLIRTAESLDSNPIKTPYAGILRFYLKKKISQKK